MKARQQKKTTMAFVDRLALAIREDAKAMNPKYLHELLPELLSIVIRSVTASTSIQQNIKYIPIEKGTHASIAKKKLL